MMKKFFIFSFIFMIHSSPAFTEDFFKETLLDAFDSAADWSVTGSRRNSYNAYVYSGRLENPANSRSGKYLAFSLQGDSMTGFKARKDPPYKLEGCVKEISLSVFGIERNARLFLDMEDIQGKFHRIPAAGLGFRGWKKISIPAHSYRSRRLQLSQESDGLTVLGFFIEMDPSGKKAEILIDNLAYKSAECVKNPCGEDISSCL